MKSVIEFKVKEKDGVIVIPKKYRVPNAVYYLKFITDKNNIPKKNSVIDRLLGSVSEKELNKLAETDERAKYILRKEQV